MIGGEGVYGQHRPDLGGEIGPVAKETRTGDGGEGGHPPFSKTCIPSPFSSRKKSLLGAALNLMP